MGLTLKQLIGHYRTDPYSDFLKLRHQVRKKHDGELTRLIESYGSTKLRDIRLRTLLVWYDDWLAGGKTARARSAVNRLRELFRFGSILEDSECDRLFDAVGKIRLESSPPRTVQMTADHARAIRETAHENFGWHMIALAQALQFELLLGQKDVIGEWVPLAEPGEPFLIHEERKWLRGLRWSDIDKNLILRHAVGSSGRSIEVDLRTAPMVLEELKLLVARSRNFSDFTIEEILQDIPKVFATPADTLPRSEEAPVTLEDLTGSLPTSGPVVYCETNGLPWSTAEFRRKWRLVAKEAGVPDNVTNRDSYPAGMIRGGPDRAKISQRTSLKRIDYSLRMSRRLKNHVE
jgi:hypothetical protein